MDEGITDEERDTISQSFSITPNCYIKNKTLHHCYVLKIANKWLETHECGQCLIINLP